MTGSCRTWSGSAATWTATLQAKNTWYSKTVPTPTAPASPTFRPSLA